MPNPFQVANLSPGIREPGFYVSVDLSGDLGVAQSAGRCLIFGYKGAGGVYPSDAPIRALSQSEVDVGCQPWSQLSHAYAAARAQIPIGAEVWLMPIDPPASGTAQVLNVEFVGEPVAGVLSSATVAAAADTCTLRYRNRGASFGITAGMTWAQIATAGAAALNAISSFPLVASTSGAVLILTHRQKGLGTGAIDDGALEVTFTSRGVSGIAAKLGTLTVSGTAGSTGTCVISMGAKSASIAVTSGDVATATGTAITNTLNGTSYPVRAAQPSSPTGTVTILAVNNRPVRPLTVTSTETGISPQAVADAMGTLAAGTANITAALANLAQIDEAWTAWALPFADATNLGAVATHIEAREAPPLSLGQVAIFGITDSLAAVTSANVVASTTPPLTATARYVPIWAQSCTSAPFELTSRLACAVGAEPYVGRSWNGFVFSGSDDAPIGRIPMADRPTVDERNAAIGLHVCPVTMGSSGLTMTWGGTAFKSKGFRDKKLEKLSGRRQLDWQGQSLAAYLAQLFAGKKIRANGEPRTTNAVSLKGVQNAVVRWARTLSDQDLMDWDDSFVDAVLAGIVVSPTRIDINVPFIPLADFDIGAVSARLQ